MLIRSTELGKNWIVREYREGDEAELLTLWKAVYPKRELDNARWLRRWHWAYRENPAGSGRIWVAEHEGRIIAERSAIPVNISAGKRQLRAFQRIDVMTHPAHRREGVSLDLASRVVEDAKKAGMDITIGFPTEAAYRVLERLGGFCVARMRLFIKPLDWNNAIGLKVGNPVLSAILGLVAKPFFSSIPSRIPYTSSMENVRVTETRLFDDRVDELLQDNSTRSAMMVARNRDHLNWRYSAPEQHYSILLAEQADNLLGYLVLKQTQEDASKVVYVYDLIAQSESAMDSLIIKAIEISRQNSVNIIVYPLIGGTIYHRVLRRNGFRSLPLLGGTDSVSSEFVIQSRKTA